MDKNHFKGTFWEKVLDILEKNEFIDCKFPKTESDEVVAEMLPLHKAMFTTLVHLSYELEVNTKKIDDLIENLFNVGKMNVLAKLMSKSFAALEEDEKDENVIGLMGCIEEKNKLDTYVMQVQKHLWEFMNEQLQLPKKPLTIRAGFMVVVKTHDE